jgi:hypothetical protein
MGINDYLFLSIVVIFCILWIYEGILKEYIQKRQKPKFRSAEYGWAEYYSHYFKCWRPFYIWSDIDKERKIHIIDRIREIEFDYKYIGEGRERIDYDIQRKLWEYFKNSKEVDDNQILLIDKENDYFRQILKNGSRN